MDEASSKPRLPRRAPQYECAYCGLVFKSHLRRSLHMEERHEEYREFLRKIRHSRGAPVLGDTQNTDAAQEPTSGST